MKIDNKKILLTGGSGFLGKYVKEKLVKSGAELNNIIIPRSSQYDLRMKDVTDLVTKNIDIVIHLAAKVGGIGAHYGRQGEFFYDNAIMGLNLIDSSSHNGVKKFVGLGSVCSYPKLSPVPFKEDDLWNGYPAEITAPYGLAKKIMLVQSQAYNAQYGFNAIHLVMINLYGPGDDFNSNTSHVIPALIRKVDEAKEKGLNYIEVWGDGTASREFLFVEDAARAIVLATEKLETPDPINVGSGREISIKNLAELICKLMDFKGKIRWDTTKSNGQPRRMLDVSRARKEFGFEAQTNFEDGLLKTINWYLINKHSLK